MQSLKRPTLTWLCNMVSLRHSSFPGALWSSSLRGKAWCLLHPLKSPNLSNIPLFLQVIKFTQHSVNLEKSIAHWQKSNTWWECTCFTLSFGKTVWIASTLFTMLSFYYVGAGGARKILCGDSECNTRNCAANVFANLSGSEKHHKWSCPVSYVGPLQVWLGFGAKLWLTARRGSQPLQEVRNHQNKDSIHEEASSDISFELCISLLPIGRISEHPWCFWTDLLFRTHDNFGI